jgi:hypothetical protein
MNGVFEISANVADEQEGYCLFTLSTATHTSLYPLYTSPNMPDCVAIVQDLPFRQSVRYLRIVSVLKAEDPGNRDRNAHFEIRRNGSN